jgi:hypothetical protein
VDRDTRTGGIVINFSCPALAELAPTHDKTSAAQFLATLDPTAQRFTFQFFSDSDDGYAEVFHGTLDDVWPKVLSLNTLQQRIGVFVTINETDFQGRRAENIVRTRALFADADGHDQVRTSRSVIDATGALPTMVVRSSSGRAHFYWCCDDLPRDQFSVLQGALIAKLGTDPAIKDLSRVMRLPGTLHLKDPKAPSKVTFVKSGQRWKLADLAAQLVLSVTPSGDRTRPHSGQFSRADAERLRRIFGLQHISNELGDGIGTNIEEIKSAVAAIPPVAIAAEPDWMKLARGLAHEAGVHKAEAEELWQVLDTASAAAPGYNPTENRRRWERYVDEAFERDAPITIATVFDMAHQHGWKGWAPAISPSTSSPVVQTIPSASVSSPNFADPWAEFVGPPFPTEILPPPLANFVDAEHRAMGADPSALAMATLTAVAGAIHAETCVRMASGWSEKPVLWTALVGSPSSMKSPVMDKATAPLRKIDNHGNARWRQLHDNWKKSKSANANPGPCPPKPARQIIQDTTPEKVAELLARSPAGSLMLHDELAGHIASFDRYGSGPAVRSFFLSCWNGGPYLKDRVGQGVRDENAEIRIDNLALCILGGVQPDRLTQIKDLTSDGLLQRYLLVAMRAPLRGDENYPVAAAEGDYAKLIRNLHGAPPRHYAFSVEAAAVRTRVLNRLFNLEQLQGFPEPLIGAVGKMKGYYGRLALTLHVANEHAAVLSGQVDLRYRYPQTHCRGQ